VDDCLFCRIAGGEVDADIVHDSGEVLAFRDINPVGPTHVLVIPKHHVSSVDALSREQDGLLGEIFSAVSNIAESEDLGDGYRVVTNVGPDAGQTVPHLHFHLIGGRTLSWPPG
jgi:histidine triad (HIT) family protein